MKKFTNKKRVQGLTFKKRDKVYLLQRTSNTKITFIWTTKLSNKLDFAKLKSFKVLKILKSVTYKLDLLHSMRITKIQYISVLEPADPEAPFIKNIPDINLKSQEKVWEVKKILNINLINNN